MTPEQTAQMKKMHQMAAIIGAAMISSVFIYGFAAHLVLQNRVTEEDMPRPDLGLVRTLLIMLAAFSIPAARPLSQRILSVKSAGKTPADPQTFSLLLSKLLTSSIILYAISETSALLGLMLCIVSGNFFDYYPFAIFSLAGILLYFPRYAQWENWIKHQII